MWVYVYVFFLCMFVAVSWNPHQALPSRAQVGDGCSGGGKDGCSKPVGKKWDRWDMAGSTYTYCYAGCHMPWFIKNRVTHNLSAYAGVVGVDHYWTGQGVPCVNGEPHEFSAQDALATKWKTQFPGGMRFLSYRILSAVPYDKVIRDKIVSQPDYFVRWKHQPNSTAPGEWVPSAVVELDIY
jgi:hypothetical protein